MCRTRLEHNVEDEGETYLKATYYDCSCGGSDQSFLLHRVKVLGEPPKPLDWGWLCCNYPKQMNCYGRSIRNARYFYFYEGYRSLTTIPAFRLADFEFCGEVEIQMVLDTKSVWQCKVDRLVLDSPCDHYIDDYASRGFPGFGDDSFYETNYLIDGLLKRGHITIDHPVVRELYREGDLDSRELSDDLAVYQYIKSLGKRLVVFSDPLPGDSDTERFPGYSIFYGWSPEDRPDIGIMLEDDHWCFMKDAKFAGFIVRRVSHKLDWDPLREWAVRCQPYLNQELPQELSDEGYRLIDQMLEPPMEKPCEDP